jgi:glycosyltransferase involved in cell wall biosynthesis
MEVFQPGDEKENIILSVARFEEGGTKKQLELAAAFVKLRRQAPEVSGSWKLVLAGGSNPDNPYLSRLEEFLAGVDAEDIEVKTNVSEEELKGLYRKSKIFWHLCGLNQDDPARVEHFGMTIVESLQNRLVPIVFDGGGQREIVEQGVSGYRVVSPNGLIRRTLELMKDPKKLNALSEGAYKRSRHFTMEAFTARVEEFFTEVLDRHFLNIPRPS